MPRGERTPARFGLTDTPAVRADLVAVGLASADGDPQPDAGPLLETIARVGDPSLALARLAELVAAAAAAGGRDSRALHAAVRDDAAFRLRLLALFGASATLGEHVASSPDAWKRIAAVTAVGGAVGTREALQRAVVDGDGGLLSPERALPRLRAAYRTELAAVAAADLAQQLAVPGAAPPAGTGPPVGTAPSAGAAPPVGAAAEDPDRGADAGPTGPTGPAAPPQGRRPVDFGIADVGRALSDLADGLIAVALDLACAAHPTAADIRLAVIAMGKCGARELNYVSDVDVIFVVGQGRPAAEPTASEAIRPDIIRIATARASEMMRICGRVAWEVDAALRPEGKAGPLVRSLSGYRSYYAKWAKTWEFQALLKARFAAGDRDLGRVFLDLAAPLVWRAADRDGFVADVQAMRRRVRDSVPAADRDGEIKLSAGGLRDVEFAVQLLQLVHGRADETLRTGGTLAALSALTDGGYVGRRDGGELATAYAFERRIEHLAQLQHLRRTHTVPARPADRTWLARSAGLADLGGGSAADRLAAELARHEATIRRLHEKLFYRPLLAAVAAVPTHELRLSAEAARSRLAALGFDAPDAALRQIAALTEGLSRKAAIQRTLLPVLLGTFADSPDPDRGLLGYRTVSDALADTPWYLRLLRDEGAVAQRLARLLGISRLVADLLERAPEVLRSLSGGAETAASARDAIASAAQALAARAGRARTADAAAAAARSSRRHEMLRLACADLLGFADADTVMAGLTSVADATVRAALAAAHRRVFAERLEAAGPLRESSEADGGVLAASVSVIAMGRFGGAEMGYASDADVLFVAAPTRPGLDLSAVLRDATDIAKTATDLLGRPSPDPALSIDADLRPEGRAGPLVRTVESYLDYWSRHLAPWQRQSLLRARAIDPDDAAAVAFIAAIDPLRYPPGGLPPGDVREIRRMKARVDAERMPRGADRTLHTKLGRGGLADIEWAVQLLQLQHAGEEPGLRVTGTLAAIDALADARLVTAEQRRELTLGWRSATRARGAIMLVTGRPGDQIPSHGRVLAGIARALGYPAEIDPGAFIDDYRRIARHARRVVDELFDQV